MVDEVLMCEAEAYLLLAAAQREYKAQGIYDAGEVTELLQHLKAILSVTNPELLNQEPLSITAICSQLFDANAE
jgi:hypothetical protein